MGEFLQSVGDRVDLRGVADHALAQQQSDHLLAQAADVHRAACGEVLDRALNHGRTMRIAAVEVGIVVQPRDIAAAPDAVADVGDAAVSAAVLVGAAQFPASCARAA